MAVALDNHLVYDGHNGKTQAYTCTGSDLFMVLGIGVRFAAGNVSSVTYNGVALTKLLEIAINADDSVHLWVLKAPATGTHNIVSVGGYTALIGVSTWTGVDQTTPYGTVVSNTGTGSSLSVTADSESGGMVADVFGALNKLGTPDASQTLLDQSNLWSEISCNTSYKAGAASVLMSWTTSGSAANGLIAIPLKPVGGAAGPVVPVFTSQYRQRWN